jgi:putative nucleotidyltransferase with HDIG domain
MKVPTIKKAEEYLAWAKAQNDGPWVKHSRGVARTAKTLAKACGMDETAAYVMGLLHDVGRYEGPGAMHHSYAGYELMTREGYPDVARICLSHSFAGRKIRDYVGQADCSAEELADIESFLNETEYDDYDRLIQLCDCLCKADGICLMEKRLVDVCMRYGVDDQTIPRWTVNFDLLAYFEKKCGRSVYSLFDAQELHYHTFVE